MAHALRKAAARALVARPTIRVTANVATRTLATSSASGQGSTSDSTLLYATIGALATAGVAGLVIGSPSIPKDEQVSAKSSASGSGGSSGSGGANDDGDHASVTDARIVAAAKVFGFEGDAAAAAAESLARTLGVKILDGTAVSKDVNIIGVADVLGVKHGDSAEAAAQGVAALFGVDLDEASLARAQEREAQAAAMSKDVERIRKIKVSHPGNLAIKNFDESYFNSLSHADKLAFLKIVRSGIENEDSGMGCYAMQPNDYDKFKPFFRKVLADYHKVGLDAKHVNDWSLDGVEGLPADGKLDLSNLGLPPLSMRVRVGRNLAEFPLPGAMTRDDRVAMEKKMCEAFDKLKAMPEYGGRYHSLTPGHPDHISDSEYKDLVKRHVMFKDMAADTYLATAGIASDWPYGRGCYVSEDGKFIIWVGEEDHLRIMCMFKGTVLNDVFDRLKQALDVVSGIEGLEFAISPDYGYVTSCPTNLGTGMRASVHIQLPNLTKDGTDKQAKKIAKPLGLSVRGTGGEHTPIGKDGTCDISPSARFCISEAEIITALYNGLKLLKAEEEKAAPKKPSKM